MTFLIQHVLTANDAGYVAIDLQIDDQQISAIRPGGSQRLSEAVVVDGRDKLLLPGFVNGHTHSSQVWQRGLMPQLPLELWLAGTIDSTPQQLEQFYLGAVSTAVDTVLSGGTCVVDHAYLAVGHELETVAALVKGYTAVGIRAIIAPLIYDLPFVAGLPSGGALSYSPDLQATRILELMEAIVQQFHCPEQGIYIGVGPTGFHRCSEQLLIGCIELSDRFQLCRHTHLLETRAQQLLAQERYGKSAVQYLQQIGFLNDRTSLAHSVWIDEADIAILAATEATVVHNPVSNLRLGSGIAPILKCRQAGVNVSFGCDGAASNDAQNMLEAIKMGTILHTVSDLDYQRWLTPQMALKMASLGGAKGVALADQIGEVAVGKTADLVLYNLAHPSLLPTTDPVQLLVLGRPTDVVDRVWVNGRSIVEQGQVQTVDVESLWQELRDRSRLNAAPLGGIDRLEPHYRAIMRQF